MLVMHREETDRIKTKKSYREVQASSKHTKVNKKPIRIQSKLGLQ